MLPSQLHQMQVKFEPLEDRLLFRLSTQNKYEYRFWFTRRYVKILWKALLTMLQNSGLPDYGTQQANDAVLSFQHEQIVQGADFEKRFEDNDMHYPLGENPVLVSRVRIKTREDGMQLLCMHPEQGQGIELSMDNSLLHSFCKLLTDAQRSTEWDLDLNIAAAAPNAETQAQPRYLN